MSPTKTSNLPKVIMIKPSLKLKTTPYTNICTALGIKPNSYVKGHEDDILNSEDVILSSNYLGGLGFIAVTELLLKFSRVHLKKILVSNNGLTNESVIFFARSFHSHPTLTTIDFSNNPISLTAVLALREMLQRNRVITEINLNNTHIDTAAIRKINRIINLRSKKLISTTDCVEFLEKQEEVNCTKNSDSEPPVTPYCRAVEEQPVRAELKRDLIRRSRVMVENERCLMAKTIISDALKNRGNGDFSRGIPRNFQGWVIVNVHISCTPNDFHSEIHVIYDVLFPKLNERYAKYKIFLHPVMMFNEINAHKYDDKVSSFISKLAVAADFVYPIEKSCPFFVQLIGEKVGLSQYDPEVAENPTEGIKNFDPILYKEYEEAGKTQPCSIVMMRASTSSIGIPQSFISRFTDDPQKAHPDEHSRVVRESVAASRGLPPAHGYFTMELVKKKWLNHCIYRKKILEEHPPELLCEGYYAIFKEADREGNLWLDGLTSTSCVDSSSHIIFEDSLYKRLAAGIDALFEVDILESNWRTELFSPIPPDSLNVPKTNVSRTVFPESLTITREAHIFNVYRDFGRSNIGGKLDLYTVTPPSRNMTLLFAPPSSGVTSTLRAFLHRCLKKNNYIIAHHFSREFNVLNEPTDPRAMLLNLMQQLEAAKSNDANSRRLPSYITDEVHPERVRDHFTHMLARVSSDVGDKKVILVVIDGIDDLDEMLIPCSSLRLSDTGVDMWNTDRCHSSQLNSTSKDTPPIATESESSSYKAMRDTYSFIPICLPKNVRFVSSCQAHSSTHKCLEMRGHDSCDPVAVTELTESESKHILLREIKDNLGVQLDDEVLNHIMSSEGSRNPGYLQFIIGKCKAHLAMPSTQISMKSVLLSTYRTQPEACHALIDTLEGTFGTFFTRKALGLLLSSRWGLTEMEFGILMARHEKEEGKKSKHSIPGDLLNRFVRLLEPVLKRHVAVVPLSGFECLLYIENRTFRFEAEHRYQTNEERYHQMLAHYYANHMFIQPHPIQGKAIKECPFHTIRGGLWSLFDKWILNLKYVVIGFQLGLGYEILREYIRAYNTLESLPFPTDRVREKDGLLAKVKEFVYFVKDHSVNLTQFPKMAHQIAINFGRDSFLYEDAKLFFKSSSVRQSHFDASSRSRVKTHREAVTGCTFATSGLRFASCSDDRSVKIFEASGNCLMTISLSASKMKRIIYSSTSRYIVSVAEDLTTFVFDASNSNLVSKFYGHSSNINSIAISRRGRYIATGSEDRNMKVWETETGRLLCTVPHHKFTLTTSANGGVDCVTAHSLDEEQFFVSCDKKIMCWKLNDTRDGCVQTMCITAHNSYPVGSLHLARDSTYIISVARATCDGRVPHTECGAKIWSVDYCRQLVDFSLPHPMENSIGTSFGALSHDENTFCSAMTDGSVSLYRVHWSTFAQFSSSRDYPTKPIVCAVLQNFLAFALHPVPIVLHLVFNHISSMLAVSGNLRQLKVFDVSKSSLGDEEKMEDEREENGKEIKIPHESTRNRDPNTPIEAVAEYLLNNQMTCLAWTPCPQDDAPEIIVGDVVGRLHSLRLVND